MSAPPPRPRRRIRLVGVAAAFIALTASTVPPVAAQDEEAPSVELQLVRQPVWQRPSDPLDIRLRIVNRGDAPIEGFLLSLTAHPVARTRSALQASFEGNAGATASATSQTFTDPLEAGDAAAVTIDEDFETPSSLSSATEGVYPLTLSISDVTGAIPYDSLTTPLILYPERPKVPLNLALVVPLFDLPSRGADAVFRDPLGSDTIPLEQAVSEGGWFTGLVAALEANAGELPDLQRTETIHVPRRGGRRARTRTRTVSVPQRGLHLGLAPTPRFLEEVADMADGYRRAEGGDARNLAADAPIATQARTLLSTLDDLLDEDGIQTLLVPYSFPDIPALARYAPDRIELELEESNEVLSRTVEKEASSGWLFAPAGRLGARSLEELRFADAETAAHTLFEPDSFEIPVTVDPPGCPETFGSFTCPVSVRTAAGPTTGLVADAGLQDRFNDLVQEDAGRLQLQNFFAETATIRQELPSVADRVVQVTVPSMWHPSPRTIELLLAGVRNAPWLVTVTPDEAVNLRKPESRTDAFVDVFRPLAADPGDALFDRITDTNELIEDFRRMSPPEQLVERLQRNTLVAESRIWWEGPALAAAAVDYLQRSVQIIGDEIGKVTIAGPDEINLTSQEGEIPLVVSNGTDFPTTVRISLRSPERDLILEPQEVPAQRIAPGGSLQFTVEAVARSSGIFQMEVLVDTAQGELEIASKSITVRSTAFNLIALGLTIGALVFLVVFYIMRVLRRRRAAS